MHSEPLTNDAVVSFDDEPLILVDSDDNVQGYESKAACHNGEGILHRAFSIFLFNSKGELMLQKRSDQKRLWPLFWTNSCCSHPRRGESDLQAADRRIFEELGVRPKLHFLFRFEYQASFGEAGSENELCSVYIAKSDDEVVVNSNEVAEFRYVDPDELDADIEARPELYTPWFKLEWPRIRREFWQRVEGA